MKKCKHCTMNENGEGEIIPNLNINGFQEVGWGKVCKYFKAGYILWAQGNGAFFETNIAIPITNCPKCGRKLK